MLRSSLIQEALKEVLQLLALILLAVVSSLTGFLSHGLKPVDRMFNLIKAPPNIRLKCNQLAFILIEKQCWQGDFDHHGVKVWGDLYPEAFWLRWDCFSLCENWAWWVW